MVIDSDFTVLMDTSGVNRLLEEEQDHLLVALQSAGAVRVSALSVLEAVANSKAMKRKALLDLQKRMTLNALPLELPGALVRKHLVAYSKRESNVTITVEDENRGAWFAITNPSIATDELALEAKRTNEAEEERFYQYHVDLRKTYLELFRSGEPRPDSARALLREYSENSEFLFRVLDPIYSEVTGMHLAPGEARHLFDSLPAVAAFFLSLGYADYRRSVAASHYGRKNAGFRDLMSGAYLPFVSRFVTDDNNQLEALSLVGELIAPDCEVVEFDEWRRQLVI